MIYCMLLQRNIKTALENRIGFHLNCVVNIQLISFIHNDSNNQREKKKINTY